MSRPYSKNLVAVTVLQATIKAHTPQPIILFNCANIEMAARIQNGSKL